MILVAINNALARRGHAKIRNDSTAKLLATGYRYPEHKCTMQTPFSNLSQKIMARIIAVIKGVVSTFRDSYEIQLFFITYSLGKLVNNVTNKLKLEEYKNNFV